MARGEVTCPACGMVELFPHHGEGPPPTLAEIGEFNCNTCAARTVYGVLMPRIVVEPSKHPRTGMLMVRLRIQDPKTKQDLIEPVDIDPKYAASLSKNILSLVIW